MSLPAPSTNGQLTNKTQHILSTAKNLEGEVARLQLEANNLRTEQKRWDELHKAGIPRRETAAADCAVEKAREAAQQEKKAREAEHAASNEKRSMEMASRSSAERLRKADEVARRAEEQLAAAESSFSDWRDAAEAAAADMRNRHMQAKAQLQARLNVAEADAATRAAEAADHLDSERERNKAELDKEIVKIGRQRSIMESRGEERRNRSQVRVQCAEASADSAETKRDRQFESAAQRAQRSQCAADSKVHLASLSQDSVLTKTSIRLDQAEKERELRLEAARAREAAALHDLDRRARDVEEQIAVLNQEKATSFDSCQELEENHQSLVDRHRRDLRAKIHDWTKLAEEVERASRQKVRTVRQLSERLKAGLVNEVCAVQQGTLSDVEAVQAREEEHRQLIQGTLSWRQQHTTEVAKLAGSRVMEVNNLTQQQVAEIEKRSTITLDQVKKEFDGTKDIMDGRVQKVVTHLMTYLEDRESDETEANALSLELWVPLPGATEEVC